MEDLIISLFRFVAVKDVEKKIRNLRTQYTREKTKMGQVKSGEGADEVYVAKWVHYKHLNFLADFVTAKSSRSNIEVCP